MKKKTISAYILATLLTAGFTGTQAAAAILAEGNISVYKGGRLNNTITGKAPADEERAAAAKQTPEWPEAEVFAGGDERRHHRVRVELVAQHQVVDVALVTRQQYDRGVPRRLSDALEPFFVEHDAVVHLRPRPRQESVHDVDNEQALLRAQLLKLLASYVLRT